MLRERSILTLISGLVLGPLAVAVLAGGVAAQEEEGPFDLNLEAGASVFFGATSQTTAIFKSTADYVADHLEFGGRLSFDYGEAQDGAGITSVTKRSWLAGGSMDYLPGGTWSPFVFVTGEGSLEKSIDLRVGGGGGIKWTLWEEGDGEFDLSGAVLYERTDPRVAVGEEDEITSLARWSGRARLTYPMADGRLTFDFISLYQPEWNEFGNYTLAVDTGLAFNLNSSISLKVSLVDRYDSQAVDRGARENNDGRLFFSLVAAVK